MSLHDCLTSLPTTLCMVTETTLFVDRLFRGLDSESYLTGHDTKTPPPVAPPPNPSSKPVSKPLPSKVPPANASPPKHQSLNPPPPAKAPPTKSHSAGTRDGTQSSSSSGSNSVGRSGGSGDKWRAGGSGSDRRYLEDLRSREVCFWSMTIHRDLPMWDTRKCRN